MVNVEEVQKLYKPSIMTLNTMDFDHPELHRLQLGHLLYSHLYIPFLSTRV